MSRGVVLLYSYLTRRMRRHKAAIADCCAGINITFQLEQLLELRGPTGAAVNAPPHTLAGTSFAHLLDVDSNAFQELYVASFLLLDKVWLDRRASYMDFPVVLAKTMDQVRHALHRRPKHVSELWLHMGLESTASAGCH
jgi:ELMO/CED-12 family